MKMDNFKNFFMIFFYYPIIITANQLII